MFEVASVGVRASGHQMGENEVEHLEHTGSSFVVAQATILGFVTDVDGIGDIDGSGDG
ncbi:hypothetical protein IWW46_006963, partial [Coemansia sp. RSA 2440]